jgi:hypothetical protein
MSLFGKVLALLNIFGAIGLVCLAAMDYAKQRAWAYSAFRHELVLRGLPLDDEEGDVRARPLVWQVGDHTVAEIFSDVGGNGVSTQVAEVNRVREILDKQLETAKASPRLHTWLLARFLKPMSDSVLERDQLHACLTWLGTDAGAKLLRDHYEAAFREAVKPPVAPPMGMPAPPEKLFVDAFRMALRGRLTQPSDSFASLVLAGLPVKKEEAAKANFGQVYDAAFQTQLAQLQARYQEHFDRALTGPKPGADLAQGIETQKKAVAGLLLAQAQILAEDAIQSDASLAAEKKALDAVRADPAAYSERLATTPTFRRMLLRMYKVCGLRVGLNALSDRSAVLRKVASDTTAAAAQERLEFVADHNFVLSQVREIAYLVQVELARKVESERKLTVQEEQVKKRQRDVKQLQEDLDTSRAETQVKVKEMRVLSQRLLDDRVKARDLIRLTEEAEKTIRTLEKMIRDREDRDDDR